MTDSEIDYEVKRYSGRLEVIKQNIKSLQVEAKNLEKKIADLNNSKSKLFK